MYMNKLIIKSFERVIVLLLVIMGAFSSCKKDDPKDESKPNYGDNVQRYGCIAAHYYKGAIGSGNDVLEIGEFDDQDENTL